MSALNECQSAISLIMGLDKEQLNSIVQTVNFRRKQLDEVQKNKFSVGDKVWFTKRGSKEIIQGKVKKLCRKNIQVSVEPFTTWTVSPTLLHFQEISDEQ